MPEPCSAERLRREFFSRVPNSYWNPKLEIVETANGDRTVITHDELTEKEPLVVLPEGLDFSSGWAQSLVGPSIDDLPRELHISAALYLLWCGVIESDQPEVVCYVPALPEAHWYNANHVTLKLCAALQEEGADLLAERITLLRSVRELGRWVKSHDYELITEQLQRAVLASSTRCWERGLVPYIDFFQHSSDGSWLSTNGNAIIASHGYQAGDEVNTCYGDRDSLDLLLSYGFRPPSASVLLPLSPVSGYARALDPALDPVMGGQPVISFMLDGTPGDCAELLRLNRLSVVDAHDSIRIKNLAVDHRQLISLDNEAKAIAAAMGAVTTAIDADQDLINRIDAAGANGAAKSAIQDAIVRRQLLLDDALNSLKQTWIDLLPRTTTGRCA